MESCSTCSSPVLSGSLFCDGCGEPIAQVQVARKLRQGSFDTIKDAQVGLLSVGERIKAKHHYVIEEAIARSGFGATFRATRIKDEKQILIKQMLEQSSLDQFRNQLLKSFKREAKFLRKLKHPAFPQGFEYFERNKSFYLVMEFINGKELAKALADYRQKSGKVEDGIIVYLGMEIADALSVIHAHGYVYRDLKPQNVMLDGISSRVKLIDFGTLYHARDKDPLIFESEGYTPPEFLNKNNIFVPSGDIYSLGALLFEAAIGFTPKLGDTSELKSSGRDPRLISVIERCLSVDPSKRYQKAREVRDELKKLTRKGLWPFRRKDAISPIEMNVIPKTLYPPTCTFCEYCGFADPASHAGYCPNCRVPLKVGRLSIKLGKDESKEFFLYSDETTVGSGNHAHFSVPVTKLTNEIADKHIRIFRRETGMWLETLEESKGKVIINRRRILGPVELLDGDTIEIGGAHLVFSLKDAC